MMNCARGRWPSEGMQSRRITEPVGSNPAAGVLSLLVQGVKKRGRLLATSRPARVLCRYHTKRTEEDCHRLSESGGAARLAQNPSPKNRNLSQFYFYVPFRRNSTANQHLAVGGSDRRLAWIVHASGNQPGGARATFA